MAGQGLHFNVCHDASMLVMLIMVSSSLFIAQIHASDIISCSDTVVTLVLGAV